jgi:hypothetical protein
MTSDFWVGRYVKLHSIKVFVIVFGSPNMDSSVINS